MSSAIIDSLRGSIATRLALGYGALLVATVTIAAAVFYFGTVGLLDRSIDAKIRSITQRLEQNYRQRPLSELTGEIERELADGIDSDTEIYLVTDADGRLLVGNLSRWPGVSAPNDVLLEREVIRDGRPSFARLLIEPLPDGGRLIVGRDLADQGAIRALVGRALTIGVAISLALAGLGASLFRRQIEQRIGAIRRTAQAIEAGQLDQRIAMSGNDEFARLGVDINRMLDRIKTLMDGVRNVSNAIAHDLRTPLSRVRSRLDDSLRHEPSASALIAAAQQSMADIDDLISLLNKLLQIAEAESGVRAACFSAVDLRRIAEDMTDLYEPAAEERGVRLRALGGSVSVLALGDHDLLSSAVASLIDNAIKYAGAAATVSVSAQVEAEGVRICVADDGPGIPEQDLPRVSERFYRVDRSRSLPGNGLGLAIVSAIATLHDGRLTLENTHPGLCAALHLHGAGKLSKP
jgi:signal transduction histidine kinase